MERRSVTRMRSLVRRWSVVGALLLAATGDTGLAVEPPLRCFGNEPSWSLGLESPGVGELALADGTTPTYRGGEARLEPLRERVWRGRPDSGGPDLVAFLREADCSDGMSDVTHPFVVRVSVSPERVLAGCCRILVDAPAPTSGAIEGPVWRLTGVRGLDHQALAAAREPATMRLEEGRLQGFGGCNRLAGGYSVDGDRLTLGALAGTMMACDDDVMVVESAFKEALAGTLWFRVVGGDLTLGRESESDPVLVFTAAEPPRLEGIDWTVTGYNNGRSAVVSPLTGTTLTLRFEAGVVTGDAGCNRFRGAYTREDARLSVGSAMATTRKHCEDDVMRQEREFLAAVQSAVVWAIDAGMLDVHRADGERVLTASRAADP